MGRRTFMLVLEIETDELRICNLPAGQKPKADSRYRVHGPFRSSVAAQRAIDQRSSAARRVLYGTGKQFVEG